MYTEVVETTGKLESEVKRYFKVFFERYVEISDHEKIIERIQKGEAKIDRILQISHTLKTKVDRHKNPWQAMTVVYGSNKGKAFTEEEDRFLICMMDKLGYGQWEQLKLEIRKAWQFRFDWFLKSRTTAEISRRCDTLVRLIEKENVGNYFQKVLQNFDGVAWWLLLCRCSEEQTRSFGDDALAMLSPTIVQVQNFDGPITITGSMR